MELLILGFILWLIGGLGKSRNNEPKTGDHLLDSLHRKPGEKITIIDSAPGTMECGNYGKAWQIANIEEQRW